MNEARGPAARVSTWWIDVLSVLLCGILLVGLLYAVMAQELRATEATALFVLGCLTVAFTDGFATSVRHGEWPRLETSWGGLGGGLGGWRLSPALDCLLGALAFGGAFTLATLSAADHGDQAATAAPRARATIPEVP